VHYRHTPVAGWRAGPASYPDARLLCPCRSWRVDRGEHFVIHGRESIIDQQHTVHAATPDVYFHIHAPDYRSINAGTGTP
jgi:hypothetical protein